MRIPVEVTYRGLDPNPAIEKAIDKRLATLEKRYQRITGCRVSVEAPHRRHRRGTRYRVRVDLTIPGAELVAGRTHEWDGAHEDLQVAIRDAFRACRRQLQDEVRLRRGEVKRPAGPPHGRITRLYGYEGYGFIETDDQREIYFDARSVLGDFEALAIGQEVRFAEEEGDEGPQASTVAPVGKSNHRLVS